MPIKVNILVKFKHKNHKGFFGGKDCRKVNKRRGVSIHQSIAPPQCDFSFE